MAALLPAEPVTEKQRVTAFARMIDDDGWPWLAPWWREECARRMLDAADGEARERVAAEYQAALTFVRAVENHVSNNRGEIDGRRSKHDNRTATKRTPKTASGSA